MGLTLEGMIEPAHGVVTRVSSTSQEILSAARIIEDKNLQKLTAAI